MKSANLLNAQLQGACLPAWSSGLLEGVKLAGAEGWVPSDKDQSNAKLTGADLSGSDLSGFDLTGADLQNVNLTNAKLHDALLPWRSGLLAGVNWSGARFGGTKWVPADKDLHDVKLKGADLSECDLSGVNLSASDLSCSLLIKANLSEANLSNSKLTGADLSGSDLSGCDLTGVHMKNVNLSNAKLHNARLPAWSSGLLEGVKLAGAEGWVPADKDLHDVKLKGADLSECDLSGVNLSASDLSSTLLSKANLSEANLKSTNLTNAQLHNARLPAWSSGLLEGVKLAGAEGWVPADKDLSNAKLKGADLSKAKLQGTVLKGADLFKCDLKGADLSNAKLLNARLPAWSSGLLEGVKLAGAEGWVPADKDLSNAKFKGAVLKGADLSKCDLSGADLTGADLREAKLEGTNLRGATLCAALLHAAQGARPATKVPVTNASGLKVGKPVVFALTAPRALTLQRVTVCNDNGKIVECDVKEMEVQTGPSATGPWTSVVKFTSRQTKQEQTFAAAPDAPLLAGFVQLLVHDTYGREAYVKSMALEGEGWG